MKQKNDAGKILEEVARKFMNNEFSDTRILLDKIQKNEILFTETEIQKKLSELEIIVNVLKKGNSGKIKRFLENRNIMNEISDCYFAQLFNNVISENECRQKNYFLKNKYENLCSIFLEKSVKEEAELSVNDFINNNKEQPSNYYNALKETYRAFKRAKCLDTEHNLIKELFNNTCYELLEIEIEYYEDTILTNEKTKALTKFYKKPLTTSFESTLSEPQLQKLLDELKSVENKFIHPETTIEQFTAIFKAKPINTIKQCDWIAEPVLLAYFIDALRELKIIRRHSKIWKVANVIFTNADNLKQLIDGYKNSKSGKPKNSNEIDKILSIL